MTLQHAMKLIEGGSWLRIRFITADVNKGTGGRVIELPRARIARYRPGSALPGKKKVDPEYQINPNHNFHFTRNLQLPDNQLRKVHPILITHINGEEVI